MNISYKLCKSAKQMDGNMIFFLVLENIVLFNTKNLNITEIQKIEDHFVRYYKVTALIGPIVYHLNLPDNMKIRNVFYI